MMTSGSFPLALSALVLGMSACILGDVEPSPVETSVATTTQPVVVAPDPADKRYVNTFQKLDPTRTDFNWQKWPNGTREVQIAGKLIVLDDAYVNSMGKDIQAGNVTRLDIYAERLIVRRPIRVPGAHVRIYARELRFEDTGAEPALLDTSAKQPPVGAEQFRNGDNGQSAGDVHLFVKEFSSQGNRFPRFRMNGGNGQNAGPGKHGAPGVSQTTFASAHQDLLKCARKHGIAASMNFHVSSFKFDPAPLTLDELENNAVALGVDLPTSGTNASPGGRPGEPGNAGSLHANLPGLAPYAEMLGGSAGLSAGYYRGGRAGQPTPAIKLASAKCQHLVGFSTGACRGCGGSTHMADRLIVPSVTRATPTDGRSVDSPSPNRSTGDAGQAELVNAPFAWLHPHSVAMTLSFVEDAFLNGFRTLAVDELTSLDQALDTYQKSPDWQALALGDQALLEQQELRVETLLGKLAARQDYFGNPEHWVPALSLEANKLLFEEEVRWAIRTIYMADWITETQERQVDRAAAIDAAKNLLRQEIRTLESQYNDALLALPQLQIDAETAASHLATLEGELLVAEQRLEARARENVEDRHKVPFWKKGLRVLASVARLIPVGQPYTGAIAGTALDAIAEVKSDAPWDSVKALPDQVKQASETIDKAKEAAAAAKKAKEEKVKPETKKTKKTLREGVKELATKLSPVIEEAKKHKALFASAEAPKEELEKELEKLKGEDAAFKEVAEKAAAITKEREAFAARLTETLDKLENAAGKMGEHYLHLAELLPEEEGITEVLLTQRAMLAIGDMRAKAEQRLLKYHYLLGRSFEYTMLRPYPGDLTLTRLFNEVLSLVKNDATGVISTEQDEQLYTLYREEISSLVELVVTEHAGRLQTTQVEIDLTPDEITRINEGSPLEIDFAERGVFGLEEENLRLLGLEVVDLRFAGAPPAGASFMDLVFEHGGLSRIFHEGVVHVFKHYNQKTRDPLRWTARSQNGTLTMHQPSPAAASLLRALLTGDDANLMLFARPSPWAKFSVRTVFQGARVPLSAVRLRLSYEYERTVGSSNWRAHQQAQNARIGARYANLLHRQPTADELRAGRELLDLGYGDGDVASVVFRLHEQEAQALEVDRIYSEHYGRVPNPAERAFWSLQLLDGRSLAQAKEYVQLVNDAVFEIYARQPTYDELKLYTQLLDQGLGI
ncbi:hypothetical protein [Polyangium jinanense]|uniref:Uncharacterized protein n=1 Tax=Polyangium jinanense TaxID=2829994 RepID=A0A9X3X9S1_9BACT|nr:hypothetical protein [Polyangium jinanense]MDC3984988.1 hypothetical protein [Polyangium jinanense]